jgi:hypothetical protein
MIQSETMLTVFGVILLGLSWGLSTSYILSEDPTSKLLGAYLPFLMNMAVMSYISYGLFDASKVSSNVKLGILFLFILLSFIELHFLYDKPSTFYGVPVALGVVTMANLFRLYFIVSMNCDFAKSLFVITAASIIEPSKVQEPTNAPNWDKAYSTFEQTLKKTSLTDDERLEQINKFRAAWGKMPKDVVLKGGRR